MGSLALGRQLDQTSTYRVTGIKIGVQNVDEGVDDNDRGAFFTGYVNYFSPSKHRINALQAARAVEKHSEGADLDSGASLFPAANQHYRGFRFGWSLDDDVLFQTNAQQVPDWTAATGKDNWNMGEIFEIYSDSQMQSDAREGALWNDRTGATDKLRWACSVNNADHVELSVFDGNILGQENYLVESPGIQDFEYQTPAGTHLEVLGGLLLIDVRNCNTIPNGDVSPDDYYFTVQIEVEGWSSW